MVIAKDRDILKKCFMTAVEKASKKGFKRQIFIDKYIDFICNDKYGFSTENSEEEDIIVSMVDDLINMEKICDFMDKKYITEFQLRVCIDSIRW